MAIHDPEVSAYLRMLGFVSVGSSNEYRYELNGVHVLLWDSANADVHTKPHPARWAVYRTEDVVHDEIIGHMAVGVDGVREALQRIADDRGSQEVAAMEASLNPRGRA